MNKLVKGAIAGAAGVALLMGGAGTLAYWNTAANIADATVSSGTLTLAATNGTWSGNPALVVPGDTLSYSSTVTITAKGTNLYSTFSLDNSTITGDAALKGALVIGTSITGVTGGTLPSLGSNSYNVLPGASGVITATVTVTVAFPSTVSGTTAQTQAVDLSNLGFTLVQRATA